MPANSLVKCPLRHPESVQEYGGVLMVLGNYDYEIIIVNALESLKSKLRGPYFLHGLNKSQINPKCEARLVKDTNNFQQIFHT